VTAAVKPASGAPEMVACIQDEAPELGSATYYSDPYPAFAARRAGSSYRPVPGVDGAWGVFGYRDAVALLSQASVKSTRLRTFFPIPDNDLAEFESLQRWVSSSILHREDEQHRHLRAILERPLSAIPVQRYQPCVEQAVAAVLTPLADAAELDVVADYAARVPTDVIGRLLGIGSAHRDTVRDAADALSRWTDNSHRTRRDTATARDAVDTLTTLVYAALDSEDSPLLTALLVHARATPETIDEIIAQCVLFLVAGRATLRHLIGSAVLLTLTSPKVRQALLAGEVTATAIVDETLRLETPVQYLRRTVHADYHGTLGLIPAGTVVMIGLGSAMRDPEYVADGDRFDPTRDHPATLAFGLAGRACIGRALARLIAATALEGLIAQRPAAALNGSPRWGRTLYYRGLAELPIVHRADCVPAPPGI
jgi:cytochrome P450